MRDKPIFTSSWDDGSIHDLRLADLLAKYNIRGTFYIPIKNKERNDSLSPFQINEISKVFEIGGHTHSHAILPDISDRDAEVEIKDSKKSIEDIIGMKINAFCFPRGEHKKKHIEMVKDAGFLFGRTVGYMRTGNNILDRRRGLMHTTLQFYPHKPHTYFLSALKRRDLKALHLLSSNLIWGLSWKSLLDAIFLRVKDRMEVFHLWGHSWEIEEYDLWEELEEFLKKVKENDFVCKTNTELWHDKL